LISGHGPMLKRRLGSGTGEAGVSCALTVAPAESTASGSTSGGLVASGSHSGGPHLLEGVDGATVCRRKAEIIFQFQCFHIFYLQGQLV